MQVRKKPGRKPRAHSQAACVLLLLEDLRGRRAPTLLTALAEKFGVSDRQIRRDMKPLVEAGHEIVWSLLDGRSAMRLSRATTEGVVPTQRERFSLLAVGRVFGVLEGTPFAEDVKRVLGRLLSGTNAKELAAWDRRFTYIADGGIKPYDAAASALLDELLTGLIHTTRVDVTYRTANGRTKTGAFEPWGLALYRHGLYFVGNFPGGTHAYILPLERFRKAERRRKDRFELPPDFDVARIFHDAIGVVVGGDTIEVVLELSAKVAHLVEVRRFHHSQKTSPLADGCVRLTMRVADTPDLLSSILAWGEHVKVIEPKLLRERVRETLERALDQARR